MPINHKGKITVIKKQYINATMSKVKSKMTPDISASLVFF